MVSSTRLHFCVLFFWTRNLLCYFFSFFFLFFPFLKRVYLALALKHLAYLSRHSATPVPFLLTVWWLLLWEWFLTQSQHESKPNRNTTGRTRSTSGYFAVLFTLAKKSPKSPESFGAPGSKYHPAAWTRILRGAPTLPGSSHLVCLFSMVQNIEKKKDAFCRRSMFVLFFFFNNTIILMRS